MSSRNTKPKRMLPVRSEIRPTTRGPRKDADLSVSENREKNVDSCPCQATFSARTVLSSQSEGGSLTGGMSSAYTARE